MKKLMFAILLGFASLAANGQTIEENVQTILEKYATEKFVVWIDQQTSQTDAQDLALIAQGKVEPYLAAGAKELRPNRKGEADEGVLKFKMPSGIIYSFAADGVYTNDYNGQGLIIGDQLRKVCHFYKPSRKDRREAKKLERQSKKEQP